MSFTAEPPLFFDGPDNEHTRKVSLIVRELLEGKSNNYATVTLEANATFTELNRERISYNTIVLASPKTANAAAIQGSLWFETTNGTVTIHHESSANTDLTFGVVFVG